MGGEGGGDDEGDNRREQNGEFYTRNAFQ
jgi:hypothetical protein